MFKLSKVAIVGVPLAVTLALLGGCGRSKDAAAPAQWVTPTASAASAASPAAGPSRGGPGTRSTLPPNAGIPPRPSTTPTAKARPAEGLVTVLTKAGIPCEGWQHYAQTSSGRDSGACFLHEGDGGQQVVVTTYGTAKQAAAAPKKAAGPTPVSMVVGAKWTYTCDSTALCRRIAGKVGGRLVKIPAA